MNFLQRFAVAGTSVCLTLLQFSAISGSAIAETTTAMDQSIADLIALSHDANAALMKGDIQRYRSFLSYTDDFTLMSPFGGEPSRASDYTDENMARMGRFFRNGTFSQEVVQTYGSRDMVVLALIERQHVEVGGLPAQDWPLRVTLVYRRVGSEWKLAHRHADPLVTGISLVQAAALARAKPPTIEDQ